MPESEIQINIKGPNELKLQISIATDKTVSELKQAVAAQSDVEADRQRLIYSGRVLKDDDQLSVYKIQSGHTVHMVKGQARQQASAPSSSAAPQIPTMQTGQNIHDPLTQLNSHLGFGAMAGINPFADLGVNPNDPNMMTSLFNDPRVLEQMASAMSNPAVVDQVIAMNPQLAGMAPQMRQVFQSEEFRRMMSNPEQLQGFMRMASVMRQMQGGSGNSPFGDALAPPTPGFPAPGVPGQNPANPSSTMPSFNNPNPSTTTAPLPGAANPTSPGSGAAGATPNPMNPFGLDPALMQQMLFGGGFGAGAGGAGSGGAGLGGFGAPPPPADVRPPEERFQVQLQQLQDMGFTNASQNVRALMATGGNVHSAIEYILSGGGL
ncbi:hypothetical protein AGABI1DRAFT_67830 [Agaricus bisporus var. burnettii JB137-S8]|uniref:Ubiquilin n=1 Tax=Agaricus bisporus var. burnettii (strain JB137-S8 / ATCC MYA-4627 / FGSC 10392) TaxID=597362 RepID=K5XLH1_AGABU|nr:uncharacterized protein AGABI1DRAFT_67830 [Agaricus bisporus var. burnettii JB137-S8]EKM84428.1 hypothetical protein AGABI1DRAFT_67830 [Agaricus bisporus var. burnettii JB137-S8]